MKRKLLSNTTRTAYAIPLLSGKRTAARIVEIACRENGRVEAVREI
jgi:hypothetical protein